MKAEAQEFKRSGQHEQLHRASPHPQPVRRLAFTSHLERIDP